MTTMATGQTNVPAATTTQVIGARSGRAELRLRAIDLNNIYLGIDDTVSTTTGYSPTVGTTSGVDEYGVLEYVIQTEGSVWVYNAGAARVIQYMELY